VSPPGGFYGDFNRFGNTAVEPLLAVAVHHEQGVVNTETQRKTGDQVDSKHRGVGHLGGNPEGEERAQRRNHGNQEWEPGGHNRAENEDEQQDGDRHGNAFGTGHVLGDVAVDFSTDGGAATHINAGSVIPAVEVALQL
jgi:hypothetical protein